MKTLLICPDLFHAEGGIARIIRLYVRALGELAAPGDKVEVVAMMDTPEMAPRTAALLGAAQASVRNCAGSRLRFLFVVLWRSFFCERIVCAHLHQLVIARLARLFRPRLRCLLVAHGIEVWRPYTLLERWALRGADQILCVSEYTRRQMLRFDPSLVAARLLVLPNTFDPDFRPQPAAVPLPESGRPRILVVSRLSTIDPYKGVDLMIEAMPAILRQYPQAQLRIVGGGNARPQLEALARERALLGSVFFLGLIDDVTLQAEYQACDFFALPSRKEGFGLVYLEAMSYGKPCLAARAGGAAEVVNEDVGALVEYGNLEQIALAIGDLMAHPRDPAAIAARVAYFSYPQFVARLRAALGQS